MADNGSVIIKIKGDDSDFNKKLNGVKSTAAGLAKITAASATVAATAIAAIGTAAVNAYADYEQLIGGVKTLFGEETGKIVQENAMNAFRTAGLSANTYMETVTSFSASLLQSLGGDTEAAAQIADMAIRDMADNANKMGTSIELIQNAYQGFAKQNYTMLDNLKLGYGGTKEEMERLLKHAEEISGVEYDINNLKDVYEAIHLIQEEMGIVNATAEESATTIQGSVATMKAAWSNMLVGIADDTQDFDQLLTNLIESVGTVAVNLVPRIEIAMSGAVRMVARLIPEIASALPGLVTSVLPALAEIGSGVAEVLPELASTAAEMVSSLANGISENLPQMIPAAVDAVGTFVENLTANADTIISSGISIIMALGEGLIQALPNLIEVVPQIVINIADLINHNATRLLLSALELIVQLGIGLVQAIPTLIANIPTIIEAIVKAFFAFQWVNLGANLITAIGKGVTGAGTALTKAAADVSAAFTHKLSELPAQLAVIGKNLIMGLINGIKSALPAIGNAAKEMGANLLLNVKDVFQIHSPSAVMRDQVGLMLGEGIAAGIKASATNAIDAAKGLATGVLSSFSSIEGGMSGVNSMISNMAASVTAYPEGEAKAGTIGQVVIGMQEEQDTLFEYLEELFEMMLDITGSYCYEMEYMGEMLMEGIVDGVRQHRSDVVEAIVAVLTDAVEAAEAAMGIHSPSKVFQTIGRFMVEGLGVGWTDGMSGVKADIVNSLTDVEDRFVSAYSRIRGVMEGGMAAFSGDIGVQTKGNNVYTSNSSTTHEGDFVVQIEKVINDGKGTVTGLLQEAEFIRRQQALAKGSA